jgi:hypothetical protein
LGGGSFSIATSGDGPRISLALWAKAALANMVQAAMAARVLSVIDMTTPSIQKQ